KQLPYIAYKTSVNTATALAPKEVHMGRLPRLPLAVFERPGFTGHQKLTCDLATDRQQCTYDIVRDHYVLIVIRVDHQNSALFDALRRVPKLCVGGWAWVYNTDTAIRHGVRGDTDAKVVKAKLSLN
ncbi:MAG: hypothetical protein ABJ244_18955, partial [Marinobacter sp.]|uniref:hypothetical protein n=1 Tax=Marinobacter sp. TaxID=50741 RepID=UPI0032985751